MSSPLAQNLAALDPDADWLDARLGDAPSDWLPVGGGDECSWAAVRRAVELDYGPADPRTTGMAMMERYAQVARVASLLFARHGRVPLGMRSAAFVPYRETAPTLIALAAPRFACLPDDPDRGHADAEPVDSPADLRDALTRTLEQLVEPAIEPLRERSHLGRKALWGMAASTALFDLGASGPPPAEARRGIAELDALVAQGGPLALAPPTFELARGPAGTVAVGRLGVCCRAYKRPGADGSLCITCPLLSASERRARALAP
jgi:hypothetical protein